MRFHFANIDRAKSVSKRLMTALAQFGITRTLSECQEITARWTGYSHWHHLAKETLGGTNSPSILDEDLPPGLSMIRKNELTERLQMILGCELDIAQQLIELVKPTGNPAASKLTATSWTDTPRTITPEEAMTLLERPTHQVPPGSDYQEDPIQVSKVNQHGLFRTVPSDAGEDIHGLKITAARAGNGWAHVISGWHRAVVFQSIYPDGIPEKFFDFVDEHRSSEQWVSLRETIEFAKRHGINVVSEHYTTKLNRRLEKQDQSDDICTHCNMPLSDDRKAAERMQHQNAKKIAGQGKDRGMPWQQWLSKHRTRNSDQS